MRALTLTRAARIVSVLALSVGVGGRADAQADPARALLRQGIADRRARRDEEALAAFLRAYALSPDDATLAQVGLAEQALGRWVEAERHLSDALAGEHPWVRRHGSTLRAALSQVRAQLGSLQLEGSPEGAAVQVDGVAAGGLPATTLRVRAGTVVVRVEAPGHHPIERRVSVEAGAHVREAFRLVPIAPEAPPAPPPAVAPPVVAPPVVAVAPPPPPVFVRTRPRAGLAVLGVGVASLATGVTLAVLSAADVEALRARCAAEDDPGTAGVECARGLGAEDLQSRASLLRDLSVAGFVLGGAAVVAGFVWWWVGGATARPAALRPGPGGATLGWTF